MSKTIMVVDDEEDIRFIIRNVLEADGYRVIEAKNGKECIENMHERIDLVLMDIVMPEMNGWDALKKIKGINKFSSIPFFMLTALPINPNEINDNLFLFLEDYILKPFTKNQLLEKVHEIINTYSKTDQKAYQLSHSAGNHVAQEYKELTHAINRYSRLIQAIIESCGGQGALTSSVKKSIKGYEGKIQIYKVKLDKLLSSIK
jgi:CheY-like chemotaxis protein